MRAAKVAVTLDELDGWAAAKRERAIVGSAGDASCCPVACSLREARGWWPVAVAPSGVTYATGYGWARRARLGPGVAELLRLIDTDQSPLRGRLVMAGRLRALITRAAETQGGACA